MSPTAPARRSQLSAPAWAHAPHTPPYAPQSSAHDLPAPSMPEKISALPNTNDPPRVPAPIHAFQSPSADTPASATPADPAAVPSLSSQNRAPTPAARPVAW